MTALSLSRRFISPFSSYSHIVLRSLGFSSHAFRSVQMEYELSASSSCDDSSKLNERCHGIKLPQLIPSNKVQMENFDIELVDPNLWPISLSLSHTLNGMDARQEYASNLEEDTYDDAICNGDSMVGNFSDFDDIEDLKMQKKLFYKLDRGSMEYDECNFNFHRKKSLKKHPEKQRKTKMVKECKKSEKSSAKPPGDPMTVKVKSLSKAMDCEAQRKTKMVKECKKSEKSSAKPPGNPMTVKVKSLSKAMDCEAHNEMTSLEGKKVRTPTFNQLTDPYHLPFCLDIFITKGSVRASVIHRFTSKVVAVAHSISKDMKFDLTYKKDATACAAVGEILAQRAIEDDIHNVVYTPRKGDKIEGKLEIVLKSFIDHGVDVKVKLKQKEPVKI